jgi:hypothetical protein
MLSHRLGLRQAAQSGARAVVPCLRNANELSKLLIASLENRLRFSRALSNLGFGKPPGGKRKPWISSSGDEPEQRGLHQQMFYLRMGQLWQFCLKRSYNPKIQD